MTTLIERLRMWPATAGKADGMSAGYVGTLLEQAADRIAELEADLAHWPPLSRPGPAQDQIEAARQAVLAAAAVWRRAGAGGVWQWSDAKKLIEAIDALHALRTALVIGRSTEASAELDQIRRLALDCDPAEVPATLAQIVRICQLGLSPAELAAAQDSRTNPRTHVGNMANGLNGKEI